MNAENPPVVYAEYIGESPELDRIFGDAMVETVSPGPATQQFGMNVGAIAASAVCLVLIIMGAIMYRRRRKGTRQATSDRLLVARKTQDV